MDYQSLFTGRDFLHHSAFSSMIYRAAGILELPNEESYPLIFVLQGSVKILFSGEREWLTEGQLAVIHRTKLQKIECTENTIILKYCPPKKLESYLKQCRRVFSKECSTPVPILPPMEEWIDGLMKELGTTHEEQQIECCAYESRLNEIIIQYPRNCLGELYVPFFAYWNGNNSFSNSSD